MPLQTSETSKKKSNLEATILVNDAKTDITILTICSQSCDHLSAPSKKEMILMTGFSGSIKIIFLSSLCRWFMLISLQQTVYATEMKQKMFEFTRSTNNHDNLKTNLQS